MKLESVEKLRGCAASTPGHGGLGGALWMRYDEATAYTALEAACDEIEREVAERCVELPVDADGEVIRIGDELEIERGGAKEIGEVTIITLQGTCSTVSINFEHGGVRTAFGSDCRHRGRTVEELLESLLIDCNCDDYRYYDGQIAKYAGRLREAVRAE